MWNIFRSISLQIVLCCFHVISFVSHAFTANSVFFVHCSVRLLCYLRNANIMDEINWITICVMWLRLVLTTFSCCRLSIRVNVMVYVWYPKSRFSLHRPCHLSSYHFVYKILVAFSFVVYFNCFLRMMSICQHCSAGIQNKFNLADSTPLWLYIRDFFADTHCLVSRQGQNQIEMGIILPSTAFMIRAFPSKLVHCKYRTNTLS